MSERVPVASQYHGRRGWTRRINNCLVSEGYAAQTQPLFTLDDRPLYLLGPFDPLLSVLRQLTGKTRLTLVPGHALGKP
jgi:hypothetical protein